MQSKRILKNSHKKQLCKESKRKNTQKNTKFLHHVRKKEREKNPSRAKVLPPSPSHFFGSYLIASLCHIIGSVPRSRSRNLLNGCHK